MREIVLDTETTGGSAKNGDRICEIGMIELVDGAATGRIFHSYFDPCCDVHWAAKRVHGLSRKMLTGQPLFADHAQGILDFIGADPVLAHNSVFDQRFVRAEMERLGLVPPGNNQWRDTIRLAERRFPRGPAKLDLLVEKLEIETPDRKIHGALLDAAILAAVVARLRGQPDIDIVPLMSQAQPRPSAARKPGGEADLRPQAATPFKTPDKAPQDLQRNRDQQRHDQACLALRDKVQEAFDQAQSFPDFMARVEASGLRVRPNLSKTTGELGGLRFRSDDVYLLSSALGLGRKTFEQGVLKYDPSTMLEETQAYNARYTADFGQCAHETLPKGRPSWHCPSLKLNRPEIAVAASAEEVDAEVGAKTVTEGLRKEIEQVNGWAPRLDSGMYEMLKSGQDDWSRVAPKHLVAHTQAAHGDESEPLRAIMYMPDTDRNTALRWVCRGLDPAHALCKTTAPRMKFGYPLPEIVVQAARNIHRTSMRAHECRDMDETVEP